MLKKQAANLISGSRIVIAVFLFFFSEITGVFLALYCYCGISDLVDGPVARKTGYTSATGAMLDTIGDVLTYLALAKIFIAHKYVPAWVIVWMLITAVGFAASGLIALKRFGKFSLVHSLFGKFLGVGVFLLPFAQKFNFGVVWMGVICTISSIAAIESILIECLSDTLETNLISIPKLLKERKEKQNQA